MNDQKTIIMTLDEIEANILSLLEAYKKTEAFTAERDSVIERLLGLTKQLLIKGRLKPAYEALNGRFGFAEKLVRKQKAQMLVIALKYKKTGDYKKMYVVTEHFSFGKGKIGPKGKIFVQDKSVELFLTVVEMAYQAGENQLLLHALGDALNCSEDKNRPHVFANVIDASLNIARRAEEGYFPHRKDEVVNCDEEAVSLAEWAVQRIVIACKFGMSAAAVAKQRQEAERIIANVEARPDYPASRKEFRRNSRSELMKQFGPSLE